MARRLISFIWLLAAFVLGTYIAYEASQLYQYRAAFAGSYTYNLLFSSCGWLIPIAVFLGIYVGAAAEHKEATIIEGKVLRHDETAFLIHWGHALSCLLLLGTGVYLGFLFIPRFINTPQMVGFILNLHFIGVLVFMFSVAMHVTDVLVAGKLKEHMPESHDLGDAVAHYAAKLRIGKPPTEGKFLASERLSYPLWIVSVGFIILTGLVKVSAHIWALPEGLMGSTTMLHDIAALVVLANLAIHVLLSTIVPWSWPLIWSMLTGYVSEEYVRHHHPLWYAEITGEPVQPRAGKGKEGKIIPS